MIPALLLAAQLSACPLPQQQKMIETQLFFGRAIDGGGTVSDADWAEFEDAVVAKNFPDGFTVLDGNGEWRDPKTRKTVHEPSKVVVVAARNSPALDRKLANVVNAYRVRFRQQSVGVVTREVCAGF